MKSNDKNLAPDNVASFEEIAIIVELSREKLFTLNRELNLNVLGNWAVRQ